MSKIWVLTADSSCAKFFEAESSTGPLQEIRDLVHSESRLHEREITSDLPGSNAGTGGSRHGLDGQTGIKEQEAINFAKEIDNLLETARNDGQFNQLVVAAAPKFLGVLRQNLNPNIARLITHELDKDLVKFSTEEIRNHLPSHL